MEIFTGKYTIKQIFKDWWNKYLAKHSDVPDYVKKEVAKMLICRDPEKIGYLKYQCPDHYSEYVVIPFSCKSRFCNVCGVAQTNKWIEQTTTDLPNTSYIHVVFTIPDYLWYFFHKAEHRALLDLLFKAAAQAVLGWFESRGLKPGITAVLHTFGKQLNYNTHLHLIVTAAGLGKDKDGSSVWKTIDVLPEIAMKKRWRAILLTMLSNHIDYSFKSMLFKKDWYVNIGIRLITPKATCKYIGRYTKRPVIAETRITDYDGNFVTFFYIDKSEGYPKKVYCRLTWEEFITRLIQHIPKPHFKMIRHYGVFANAVKNKHQKIIFRLLNQTKKIANWLKWRARHLKWKKVDPLICKICGKEMVLKELAFRSRYIDCLWVKRLSF